METQKVARKRPAASPPQQAAELLEIAVEGYLYGFPLVLMDLTRRVMTNAETAADGRAPMNQFAHMPSFPDARFTDVVRPNADTLYSALWFDVSNEPLVLDVPDSGGRYYLLEMLDLWSDVFASPGKRTTGTGAQKIAIAAPAWQGRLPADVQLVRSPTNFGWIIGRTQTNGPADYDNVHAFQRALLARPLSGAEVARGTLDRSISSAPPIEQVTALDGEVFFTRFAELLRANPPHANDYPVLARLARLGLVTGQLFAPGQVSVDVREAMNQAPALAQAKVNAAAKHAGELVNGWHLLMNPVGTYGTDYLRRALIALGGLGANPVEDAVYPSAFADSEGKPLHSSQKYVIHFEKEQLPEVRAFWSLTLYNEKQFFADNPINRYAIGDRDALEFNADGSLDLLVQRDSPGITKESNWLPAPASGGFSLNLRLYWPSSSVLDGTWKPPPVRRSA